MSAIKVCLRCGHILNLGPTSSFGLGCRSCGNKYTFGQSGPQIKKIAEIPKEERDTK